MPAAAVARGALLPELADEEADWKAAPLVEVDEPEVVLLPEADEDDFPEAEADEVMLPEVMEPDAVLEAEADEAVVLATVMVDSMTKYGV